MVRTQRSLAVASFKTNCCTSEDTAKRLICCARAGSRNPDRDHGVHPGMFENTLIIDTGTRRPWTMLAGLSGHLLALTIRSYSHWSTWISCPSFASRSYTYFRRSDGWLPRLSPGPQFDKLRHRRHTFTAPDAFAAPARIPRSTPIFGDEPEPLVPGATGPFVPGAIYDPHASPSGRQPIERIRVGGDVQAARIVHCA
jgi:hypothetical protein